MKGLINADFEPVVEVSIVVDGSVKKFKAIIDTGFNGFISIPHAIIDKTSWQFIGFEAYELASGEIIKDKVYLGDIRFDGKKRYTYILSSRSGDILIGTKFLADKILVMNFSSKEIIIRDV